MSTRPSTSTDIDVDHIVDRLVFFPPGTKFETAPIDFKKKKVATTSFSPGKKVPQAAEESRLVDTLKFYGFKHNGERHKFLVYEPLSKQMADLLTGSNIEGGMLLLFPSMDDFDNEELCWVSKTPSAWEQQNENVFLVLTLKTKVNRTGAYQKPVLTAAAMPQPFPYQNSMTVGGETLKDPMLWDTVENEAVGSEEKEAEYVPLTLTPVKIEDILGMKRKATYK